MGLPVVSRFATRPKLPFSSHPRSETTGGMTCSQKVVESNGKTGSSFETSDENVLGVAGSCAESCTYTFKTVCNNLSLAM